MNYSNAEIIEAGMACLFEHLDFIDAEKFIVEIKRDSFDYTEWQREHFSGMSVEELNEKAAAATENYVPPKNVKIV